MECLRLTKFRLIHTLIALLRLVNTLGSVKIVDFDRVSALSLFVYDIRPLFFSWGLNKELTAVNYVIFDSKFDIHSI